MTDQAPAAAVRVEERTVVVDTVPGTLRVACPDAGMAAQVAANLPDHYDHIPAAPLPDGRHEVTCELAAVDDGVWAPLRESDWRRIDDRPERDGWTRGLAYEHIQEYWQPPADDEADDADDADALGTVEYVTKRGSSLRVDPHGHMTGRVSAAERTAGAAAHKPLRDLVAVAYARVWRQHGWFVLHCSAVITPDGQAFAFPAFSGNGKSALLLALVLRGNAQPAGDDKLILREEPGADGGTVVRGYPMQRFVNLTQDVADHYPQLEFIRRETDSPTWPKVRIDMARAGLGDAPVPAITLSRICFPRVADGADRTRLEPASELDATDLLLTQSVVSLEPPLARQHLRVLTRLVQQCRCDRLHGGLDVYRTPEAFCHWLQHES